LRPADHPQAVRERPGRVAVGDSTRYLVGEEEPEPDRELQAEIRPAARQVTPSDPLDAGSHRPDERALVTDRRDCRARGGRRVERAPRSKAALPTAVAHLDPGQVERVLGPDLRVAVRSAAPDDADRVRELLAGRSAPEQRA